MMPSIPSTTIGLRVQAFLMLGQSRQQCLQSEPTCSLFLTYALVENIFPENLKFAFIRPVYKKGMYKVVRTIGLYQLLQCLQNSLGVYFSNTLTNLYKKKKFWTVHCLDFKNISLPQMLFYTWSEHYTKTMIILKFQLLFSLICFHWTKAFDSISHKIFSKWLKRTLFQRSQLIYMFKFLKTDSSVMR